MLTFSDILSARERLAPFVPMTPLRTYASLDQAVGSDITVFVNHELHSSDDVDRDRLDASTPPRRRVPSGTPGPVTA